jgi:hypothetical protein
MSLLSPSFLLALPQKTRLIGALLVIALCTGLGGCARKFSVSVNDQTLYDPRAIRSAVTVADAGLQSCINLVMRQREFSSGDQILNRWRVSIH